LKFYGILELIIYVLLLITEFVDLWQLNMARKTAKKTTAKKPKKVQLKVRISKKTENLPRVAGKAGRKQKTESRFADVKAAASQQQTAEKGQGVKIKEKKEVVKKVEQPEKKIRLCQCYGGQVIEKKIKKTAKSCNALLCQCYGGQESYGGQAY